jgi:lipopolysaccharide export system permease protein
MLNRIDRYIIKKFLFTFFFMMGIIMVLAMVFDISEKLGDFIVAKAPISAIIFDYYVNFFLFFGNMFSSMIIFIAVIWFTAKMAQETEIIPILFSGKPFNRFLRPYMVAATILMMLSMLLNHYVLPKSNKTRLDFENAYYRDALSVANYYAEFPGNQSINFHSYYEKDNVVNSFVLDRTDANNNPVYFLKARTAVNEPGTNKWRLTDYYESRKDGVDGMIHNGHIKDTVFDFTIEDMAQRENVVETMTYSELKDFIEREKAKGSSNIPTYEIELYKRTSLPFATYVLTIIGVSVSCRKKRGGIGINIALGLAIVFIYIFAMQVATMAAIKVGFPTLLSVWVPNILFGATAYILYRYAPK